MHAHSRRTHTHARAHSAHTRKNARVHTGTLALALARVSGWARACMYMYARACMRVRACARKTKHACVRAMGREVRVYVRARMCALCA
jgi:hypothetical protein